MPHRVRAIALGASASLALLLVLLAAPGADARRHHDRGPVRAHARDDARTVVEDGPVKPLKVLANDRNLGARGRIRSTGQGVHGSVAIVGAGADVSYAPNHDYCGRDTFSYALRRGSSATVSIDVTCVDDAPAAAMNAVTVEEDTPAAPLDVLSNDDDVDGGPRAIEAVTQPGHGVVAITGGGSGLTYEATDHDYCGPDSFSYTLNGGSTATVFVNIACVDDPPVAVADSRTISEDAGATTIVVMGNDTDVDGGPRSVAAVTQGAHGSVSIGADGVTYRPGADYCGPDSFTYTLNGGSSATVSIAVECVDDPSGAAADAMTITEDDPATTVDVLANDPDIDGGPRAIASVTQGAHGVVLISPGGGSVTYRPAHNFCGTDTFTYRLTPGGASAPVAMNVTCVDDPPSAEDDAMTIAEDDPATTVDVLANDPDVDGGVTPKSVQSVTQGAHGTVAISGGGTAVTYKPAANFCGDDTFTYALSPGGSVATVTMTVTCVDDLPTAADDSVSFTEDDSATKLDVLANDPDVDAGPKAIQTVTQGEHGAVAIVDAGLRLTYRPDPGYCGADHFTYTINGGTTATVSVSIACLEAGSGTVTLSTDPALLPLSFDRTVDDFAIRCNPAEPVEVDASVAPGYSITIGGKGTFTGSVHTTVALQPGFELLVTVARGDGRHRYHVRCLPNDFGSWEYTRLLPPDHRLYVVAPTVGAVTGNYVVVFDDHGVPVWWDKASETPFDAKVLPDGTIGWTQGSVPFGRAQIHALNGTLLRTVDTGSAMDIHELQQLPNGDLLVLSYPVREHVDLTAYGGGADDSVFDAEIQELDPQGNVVWSWNSKDHIGLAETGRWYENPQSHGTGNIRDIVHINTVEPDGPNAFLISLRHTDAVYKIDRATGDVVWKLGGTTTPKSLAVLGDPYGSYPFGGQHDVRLQPDGTITVHDNQTGFPARTPRAVRYSIDEQAMTATLLEEVTDPEVTASFCCGSARRSADGSWLISWGGNSLVTEFDSAGDRTFQLGFGSASSYRAVSVPEGLLDLEALRAGMNAMVGQ